jgi:bifunctional non-homologous end joining protein LigD
MQNLKKYNNKRDFKKTNEPSGKKEKSIKNLRFVVQHHIAKKDHYDFRLEYDGVLLSWAIPKGPSYNPKDKRLAVHVENHPLSYRNFEGIIPQGEYGAGSVMIWDNGYYEPLENIKKTYPKGYLKFILKGKRLKGKWTLVKYKENNWLLIKEKDNYSNYDDINNYLTSIKSNKTMEEIIKASQKKVSKIKISNPDKIIYENPLTTKEDIVKYYEKISVRMLPYLKNRLISTVRCPNGVNNDKFFKKHFAENKYLKKVQFIKNHQKEDYYYINDLNALLSEVQMNSIEFHIWGSTINKINQPNYMVFDLDPDEGLELDKIRCGVKDLKKVLDELNLKSYLKTSGGKGYHVIVPLKGSITWSKFKTISKDIATLLEEKYPDKYTSNIRKSKRKGKIFIDYLRNTKGATSVCPYSLRARNKQAVSMPIKWSELDKIKPDEIDIKKALKRLKLKDPWEDFFD